MALTHGHTRRQAGRSSTYICWQNMIARCLYRSYRKFKNYGGRGIKICDRWLTFANFLADMGEQPTGWTIERINRNGNYEPGNCRWATYAEQNRNRAGNRYLTARGQTLVLEDWATRLGTAPPTIHGRLQRGWSVEAAVTVPVKRTRRIYASKRTEV